MEVKIEDLKQHLLVYKKHKHPLSLSVLQTYLCGCYHTYSKVAASLVKKCVTLGYISHNNNGTFTFYI